MEIQQTLFQDVIDMLEASPKLLTADEIYLRIHERQEWQYMQGDRQQSDVASRNQIADVLEQLVSEGSVSVESKYRFLPQFWIDRQEEEESEEAKGFEEAAPQKEPEAPSALHDADEPIPYRYVDSFKGFRGGIPYSKALKISHFKEELRLFFINVANFLTSRGVSFCVEQSGQILRFETPSGLGVYLSIKSMSTLVGLTAYWNPNEKPKTENRTADELKKWLIDQSLLLSSVPTLSSAQEDAIMPDAIPNGATIYTYDEDLLPNGQANLHPTKLSFYDASSGMNGTTPVKACYMGGKFYMRKADILDLFQRKVAYKANFYDFEDDDAFEDLNQTSIYFCYGYNVNATSGPTRKKRRAILTLMNDYHVRDYAHAINFLKYLIRKASGKSNMGNAIAEWESDIDWLNEQLP